MPKSRKRAEELFRCSEACRASMLLMGKTGASEEAMFTLDACSRMCRFLAGHLLSATASPAMMTETARTLRRASAHLARSRASYCKVVAETCIDLAEDCEACEQESA